MNPVNPPGPSARRKRDPLAVAAIVLAFAALIFSVAGPAIAQKTSDGGPGLARLDTRVKKLNSRLSKLRVGCPISNAVRFGSWCLEASLHQVPAAAAGTNDYLYAAQKCAREGGWLPTAAQLIGAAPKAPLSSTIDDNPGSSGAEEFPEASRGIRDQREMSADLFTTVAGSEAAGSEGVTAGSKGNGAQGEPDPVPMPANPVPDTLDYVTVYDNHNVGGFAGGEPVGKAENFRCAYAAGFQGKPRQSKES
jgi:hypothetical protein